MQTIGTCRRGWIAAAMAMMMTMTASIVLAADRATGAAEAQRPADDTGRNTRDRDGNTLTADKQSNRKSDVEITREIRRAIVKDDSLSTNAHNVKIITRDGAVTLRGPVANKEEKETVAKKAEAINGVGKVDNQLEIAKP
jgi:hyperosmotically inducible periplasmic protein